MSSEETHNLCNEASGQSCVDKIGNLFDEHVYMVKVDFCIIVNKYTHIQIHSLS